MTHTQQQKQEELIQELKRLQQLLPKEHRQPPKELNLGSPCSLTFFHSGRSWDFWSSELGELLELIDRLTISLSYGA